jgi:hypothetical protein
VSPHEWALVPPVGTESQRSVCLRCASVRAVQYGSNGYEVSFRPVGDWSGVTVYGCSAAARWASVGWDANGSEVASE